MSHLRHGVGLGGRKRKRLAVHHPEVREEELHAPPTCHVVEVSLEDDAFRLGLLPKRTLARGAEASRFRDDVFLARSAPSALRRRHYLHAPSAKFAPFPLLVPSVLVEVLVTREHDAELHEPEAHHAKRDVGIRLSALGPASSGNETRVRPEFGRSGEPFDAGNPHPSGSRLVGNRLARDAYGDHEIPHRIVPPEGIDRAQNLPHHLTGKSASGFAADLRPPVGGGMVVHPALQTPVDEGLDFVQE